MSTVTGWFPLVLTTLFGGAVGSLVTTYGSQTGERRNARSRVRTELHRISSVSFRKQNEDQLTESLNDFEITAMLAGLPEGWVQLYTSTLGSLWLTLQAEGAEAQEIQEWRKIIQFLTRELTAILADATWHPWRTRLRRWHLVRRYGQVYAAIHVSLLKGLVAANGGISPNRPQSTSKFLYLVARGSENSYAFHETRIQSVL
jgi:cytochrome bd-type quinol oxidase subunit 2